MNKDELLKKVSPIIELFAIGKTFKVTELFDPVIWISYPSTKQKEIALMFNQLVPNELVGIVNVKESHQDLSLQVYAKVGKPNVQEKKSVFPDEPVSIKRNERGNA